jgi:glutathione S-transferase
MQEIKRGSLELMQLRRPAFKTDMEVHFQILEGILDDRRFLLAETPSLADFAVFGVIYPLHYSGNGIPDKFKRLQAWYDSIDRI